jgi:cytochrome c biogenesis protein ResB
MNFLGYLSFLMAIIFTVSLIICMAVQQIVTYHSIIEKARKFANNKYFRKNQFNKTRHD